MFVITATSCCLSTPLSLPIQLCLLIWELVGGAQIFNFNLVKQGLINEIQNMKPEITGK